MRKLGQVVASQAAAGSSRSPRSGLRGSIPEDTYNENLISPSRPPLSLVDGTSRTQHRDAVSRTNAQFVQRRDYHGTSARQAGHRYDSNTIRFGPTGVSLPKNVLRYPTLEEEVAKFKAFKAARTSTIDRLDALLHNSFGRGYKVRPFGSTCYGAGQPGSDVDLCVFDLRRKYGFPPETSLSDLPPIYDVTLIADVLAKAGYKAVSHIQSAAVPIVKFTDPETGLPCDLNVNRRLGYYNTELFKRYCLLFPPLAPLLRRVKSWARHVALNSPSTPGVPPSFSSFALNLMTIAWLQREGYLPNLQADTHLSVDTHFWDVKKAGEHYQAVIQYRLCKEWSYPREYMMADAVRGWFCYWGYIHTYQSTSTVFSIRDGGLVGWDAATNPPTDDPGVSYNDPDAYKLVVLDPFVPKNCTGRIRSKTLKEFQAGCREQYARLQGVSTVQLRDNWDDLLIRRVPA